MKSFLDAVLHWEERLERAEFRVAALARICRVSERELRRYIQCRFRTSPHRWILRKRMEMARAFLKEGKSVKETSAELKFKQESHFCREFKRFYRASPTDFRRPTGPRKPSRPI